MKISASTEVEWATITPDKVVVANTENAWICSPFAHNGQFADPTIGIGDSTKTSKLLDGAMAAASMATAFNPKSLTLSSNRLVWQLIGAYQIAYATPILMRKASQRFAIALRHDLSNWALEKARKKATQARLLLIDIESLGYRSEELVRAITPSVSTTLVNYCQRSVRDKDPIDCVGYVHALERLSLSSRKKDLQKIDNYLPSDVDFSRYLELNNTLGGETKNVEGNADLIARLSSAERTRVIRACYETALLAFSPSTEAYLSEIELEYLLQPFRLEA